ncbi:hypothetical protein ICA16_05480 [Pseudomonas anatoliensis]|jgi:OOP family OmpA-OmpF porin|uniref:hypothetical protein n=1 Tax=Pseudomonas anatoliensis TaxID=2710589 RepID=UPI001B34259E|nr:hypothetical protein [Pseudomonas anatoliensis]MBP5955107.1 hypothetical protein [Pseudomonas anatoliensis]
MLKQKKQLLFGFLTAALVGPLSFDVGAAPSAAAFGAEYKSGVAPSHEQSQVIYYRKTEPDSPGGAAFIYVDHKFHNSLLLGGYTRFCLAPGKHVLGGFMNEVPLYLGKANKDFEIDLEAGKTYFFRVSNNKALQSVHIAEAEHELFTHREQRHTLSRASNVQECGTNQQVVVGVNLNPLDH